VEVWDRYSFGFDRTGFNFLVYLLLMLQNWFDIQIFVANFGLSYSIQALITPWNAVLQDSLFKSVFCVFVSVEIASSTEYLGQ